MTGQSGTITDNNTSSGNGASRANGGTAAGNLSGGGSDTGNFGNGTGKSAKPKKQGGNHVLRKLKTRQISMIALGGCIGTGLFMTSGGTIAEAGPGGGLVAYAAMGVMIYFLMTSLGELATNMPVSGSFAVYSSKYVDPALGFAMGWDYWLNWAIAGATDISTAALLMQYWFPKSPGWVWSLTMLVIIFCLNAFVVSAFGETEFWLALIKVVTIIIFIVVGLLMIFGIMFQPAVGFQNFTYKGGPFIGGLPAIMGVFLIAGYSFQGTEVVGVTAGESENPTQAVPKAINNVFWRIILFYLLSIFVIAAIIPYTDPNLLGASDSNIAMSPFTIVFEKAGLAGAASIMNAVVLTSILSAVNTGAYASSRMLYGMAKDGYAPKFLGTTTKRGVPLAALITTLCIEALAFSSSIFGPKFYMWLVTATGLTGFISWIGIALSHFRFRRAFKLQGHQLSELKYRAKLFPFGPILAIVLCLLVICGQDLPGFASGNWGELLATYFSVILVAILYFGFKFTHHTHIVRLKDMDVSSARPEVLKKKAETIQQETTTAAGAEQQ
ncbi:amino acid permease [Bifidobacterium sp. ESL0800]|uniref:amino acid permease n=1 Tax=Bifidobacterium sp. ESL0800 TaxID=2983236 RepID=UPI0023F8434E|nr:amino acid permease [Bifidobacterium sp. ESL0800]WEV75469.1 amino acid permease [Bifidobacterium sp. ESL0800]